MVLALVAKNSDLKQKDAEQAYIGSTIGSTEGNVNIVAGKDLSVKGSDVIAKQDINLTGENVLLESHDAQVTYNEEYRYEKSGLTIALTGTITDIYDAAKAIERVKEKDNDQLLALQSIKSGLTAVQALQDLQLDNQKGDTQASIGVSITVGTQITERKVNEEKHSVVGSGISAGQDINIIATGNEQQSDGDITVKGSEIRAGNDISLEANRDLNLIGAVNTQHSDRDEKSYGGEVGVSFALGGSESGWRIKGNANFSQERENSDGSAWSEGIISANNNLTVKTGNDATIIGGQLEGDSIKMDIGNNLNIQSLQDTDNYDYEKISASVSASGGTGFSGNLSLSQTEIESNWASVTDQSGIFAGSGGYDITVGNNTDLKGAVIASSAEDKANNKLDTCTISFSDIENKADFDVSHVSINIGTSGTSPTAGAPTIYHNSGSDHSTTKSAVEDGELIVRNQDEQQQNVNQLSRDTENANNPLAQIFDKQKELDRMEALELVKDIAAQAKDITNKYDRIKAQDEVNKNKDELSYKEAEKAYNKLSDDDKAKITLDKFYESDKEGWYYSAVDTQIKTNQSKNLGGVGSSVNKGIDAATSIVTGLITGDIVGGLAGAGAPYIAEQIKEKAGDNDTARLVAHAILGAAVAELQDNSALAGGTGAVTGEIAADIIRKELYDGREVSDLTEAEKENISALAQLASGLAVAGGGGDINDIGTTVAGSKNAVENNKLGPVDQSRLEELRKKRDESFLTPKEKIEMFLLDENDQKGDHLVAKFFKDPDSLTDSQRETFEIIMSRYYEQEKAQYGEQVANQSVIDLLNGVTGYRPHNYDFPYLSYSEHQDQYIDAYWESVDPRNLPWYVKAILHPLTARDKDANEDYFNNYYIWEANNAGREWERQVGRPVMNFLPGGIGFVYNAIDTAQGSYALGEGVGQIYHDGKFTTDAVLKVVDGVLTLAPVVTSNLIPKGNSTGATGSVILDKGTQIELAPGSNSIGNINSGKTGTMIFEQGSTPNANEIRAGSGFLNLGYDVVVKKEVNQHEIRTQDLYVEGVGKVDVYTPNTTKSKNIINAIEKKDSQTSSVLTQIDLSSTEMQSIANRIWGKPNIKNINTLFFQDSKGQIIRYDRPIQGVK